MNKKNLYWIIGIIAVAIIFFSQTGQKEFKKEAGETMERSIPVTYIHPNEPFTYRYNVLNPNPPYFFSIKDTITGGCTVAGGTEVITTLTSPTTYSELNAVASSATGYCYFNGDYKLGSNANVNFPQGQIRVCFAVDCVQSSWGPTTDTYCPGDSFTQTRSITTSPDCGGTSCGATSQSATGTKNCGSTTTTGGNSFPNGCSAQVCQTCYTYGDGFTGTCTKDTATCDNGVDRTELGCTAQEWINANGDATLRTYLGESAQDWIDNGGPA